MKIRFIKTVQAETEGRNKGPTYKEGTVLDLPEDSANRWLRRSVAVEHTDPPKPAKAEAPKPVEAKPVEKPKAEKPKAKAKDD